MSKGGNSAGLSKLAALFKETAKGEIPTNPPLELGTINDDYSLTTDSFPVPIPMGDYLVCRHLKQWTTEEVEDHKHHIPGHKHAAEESTVSLTANDAGDHAHTIPEHSHTATENNVSLTAKSAGSHDHTIAAHNHGGAVSAQALTADSNGSHTHDIDGHSHTIDIGKTSQSTNQAGTHTHTIDGHNHVVTIEETEQDTEEAGKHSHNFPEEWTLNKGDRVLVAWAKNDAVVIDVIIQAKEVFK